LVASLEALGAGQREITMVLVTHHVEEIPPGFDQIVMMSGGRVSSIGQTTDTLTSQTLSAIYRMDLTVEHRDGRFTARGG
jgi:iron complex transport system ATP-binding protein